MGRSHSRTPAVAWALLSAGLMGAVMAGCALAGGSESGPHRWSERRILDAGAHPTTTGGHRSTSGNDDPCADPVGPHRRALCAADSHDGGCVGLACARTESRTAIECLLEQGEPDATFVALSRATNPTTRIYAREALLRRDAMTMGLIAQGLTDPAAVTAESGCIVSRVAVTEPAFVALVQRHGAEADALLVAFLGSTLGHELLFESAGDGMLQLGLSAVRDPKRSASVSAMRMDLERELAARGGPHGHEPLDPAEALSRWTHVYGCDPDRPPGTATAAEEAAEVERLLLLERELAAQSR